MYVRVSTWTAAMAASLTLTALAGCSAPEPDYGPPPPPPAETAYDRAPIDLAGAPPSPPVQDSLAGGPGGMTPPPALVGMAPIADPEDMDPAERHRIYGTKYDGDLAVARANAPAAPRRRSAAPSRPQAAVSPARPAVIAKAPIREKPVARQPLATPVPPATPAPLDPKLTKLQAALAPAVSAGAAVTVAAPLSQRLEGPVVLTLPQTLFDLIGQEAAKLGLGRAARTAEVRATLSGQGYDITPNGPQTAPLKSGDAATFEWQVRPGGGALGPLTAQVDATLSGQRPAMTFPLGTITKAAPVVDAPIRRGLGVLNLGVVDVPGLGRMRGETLVGGGLLLLALILLVAIARNASLAEERARQNLRKAREQADAEAAASVAEPNPKAEAPKSKKP